MSSPGLASQLRRQQPSRPRELDIQHEVRLVHFFRYFSFSLQVKLSVSRLHQGTPCGREWRGDTIELQIGLKNYDPQAFLSGTVKYVVCLGRSAPRPDNLHPKAPK